MNYTVVFVCQKGLIEMQSLILATSLRKYLKNPFKIIAAVPKNLGKIDNLTIEIFKELEIEIKYFKNKFKPMFYMANKPYALTLSKGPTLFIDSDAILNKEFHPNFLPDCESFCFTEDPFFSYSVQEWKDISNFFNVNILKVSEKEINLQCTNTPMLFCKDASKIGNKWLDFTHKLHSAVHLNKISMNRKRKIANMCYGMAIRSLNLDFHISTPLTWDGNYNWWNYPKCQCHPWEKNKPIKERTFNKFLCQPDLVYYYENNKQKCLGLPYIFCLPNGFGYCPFHQGGNYETSIGLDHYPEVRKMIYNLLSDNPKIDQHPEWRHYQHCYFHNKNTKWFQKPEHYGTKKELRLI